MTKIHLDTDLGGDIDDLCALAMLVKLPDVQITGITTNTENDGKRAGYTKYALRLAGREDIPVKAGADVSGGYFRGKPGLPKETDYWPEAIEPSPSPLDEALELLKNSIEQGASIIEIGACTNLRLLDEKYPGILKGAKIFFMGGYIYPTREGFPQWGNDMDWNIQADVNSAKYVLENSSPTLIPLTVTVETSLRRSYLETLKQSGDLGTLIARQAEAFAKEYENEEKIGKTYNGLPNDIINFQHDALSVAVALGWEGVTLQEVPLSFSIKDGFLHETIDPQGKKMKIVTQVDGQRFGDFWLKTVSFEQTLPSQSRK